MKKLILILALVLIGCSKAPLEEKRTDNPEMTVGKLFTHDGCSVYRFHDYGRAHYFVKCPKEAATLGAYSEANGKAGVNEYRETIQTK